MSYRRDTLMLSVYPQQFFGLCQTPAITTMFTPTFTPRAQLYQNSRSFDVPQPRSSKRKLITGCHNLEMEQIGHLHDKNDVLYMCSRIANNTHNLCKLTAPPRTKVFAWLMFNNKLLIIDNLRKRGWAITNMCVMYRRDAESVTHIFNKCSYNVPHMDNIDHLTMY